MVVIDCVCVCCCGSEKLVSDKCQLCFFCCKAGCDEKETTLSNEAIDPVITAFISRATYHLRGVEKNT